MKLKLHSELSFAEGEEFLEVVSLDRGEAWCLCRKEEAQAAVVQQCLSELVKKLVAPSLPTAADPEEHTASGHAVFRTWCRECCIGRGRVHQHRAGGRETAILAIAIDHGYLNERDDQPQETAGAPIWVSKCDRDRWIGATFVPTKGADEHAIAELKNDVSGSSFAEVLVRSDNDPATISRK